MKSERVSRAPLTSGSVLQRPAALPMTITNLVARKLFPEDVRSYPSEMTFALDQVMISDQGYRGPINIFHKLHLNVAVFRRC